MFKPSKIAFFSVLLTLGFCGVQAQQYSGMTEQNQVQNGALITDRPDATESPNTVEQGFIQIETGGYYMSFEAGDITREILGYNTTLARIGLLDKLELRLGVNYEDTGITSGMGEAAIKTDFKSLTPMLAGIKLNLFKGQNFSGGPGKTDFGFLGHVYLPFTTNQSQGIASGDSEAMPQTTGADFRFSVGHELSDRAGIAYNLGGKWSGDATGMAFIYTVVYGYALSERIGAYVELYGDAPELSSANHYWDTGFTYLADWNLQYDVTFGRSITEGQDILLSAGLSYKFGY